MLKAFVRNLAFKRFYWFKKKLQLTKINMKENNKNFRSKLFLKQHYGFITLKTTLKNWFNCCFTLVKSLK